MAQTKLTRTIARTLLPQILLWIAGVGIVFFTGIQPTRANNNDAMVVYDTQTVAGRALYYRTWNGSAWAAEAVGESPYSGQPRFNVVKYSPTANAAVWVTETASGNVSAQVWDGTVWNNWISLGNVGSGSAAMRGFDVAYETSSGDAIVVYGDTTADPNYRVWNGSTWSGETNIDISPTGVPNWIQMESAPSGDEIMMIVLDANGDVFGSRWTGSAWDSDWDDTGANPDTVWDAASSQSTGTYQAIDVAYETNSGNALFAWGDSTQDVILYKTYVGTTLSGDNTLTIAAADGLVNFLKLDRNRNSGRDDILLGESDAVSDLSTRRWDGTVWDTATEHPEHSAAIETATNRCWDIVWDYYSGNLNHAWIIYGDGTQASRKYMTIATGSTNWGAATTMLDDSDQINLVSSPGNGAILVADNYNTGSSADDIYEANRASDGTTWSAGSAIWAGTTVNPGYEEADVAAQLTGGNNGLFVYAKEAVVGAWGTSTLSWRQWTGSWGGATPSAMATVRGDARFLKLAFSSYRDEAILVSQSIRGEVDAQVFNGSTWGNYQRMNSANNADLDIEGAFDVAYEDTTGDALVVYNNDSAADPAYRVWNGSSWGSEATIDIQTSAEPSWIRMATKRGTDDIAMISIDTAEDVYGMYWTGSAWDDMNSGGVEPVWDAAAADDQYQPIDVAFENNSGDVMFVWGGATATNNVFRTYSGGTLSAADTTNLDIAAAGGTTRFVKLATDPSSGSDMILYGQNDSASNMNTRKWSGSAWDTASEHAEHDVGEIGTDRIFDIVWETYSGDAGKAWLLWGDDATVTAKEATVSGGTLSWAGGAVITSSDDTNGIQLIAQPDSGALLSMQYQSTASATLDIVESNITDGGTTWSAVAQIWAGATVAVPGYMRVALATELYDQFPLGVTAPADVTLTTGNPGTTSETTWGTGEKVTVADGGAGWSLTVIMQTALNDGGGGHTIPNANVKIRKDGTVGGGGDTYTIWSGTVTNITETAETVSLDTSRGVGTRSSGTGGDTSEVRPTIQVVIPADQTIAAYTGDMLFTVI